MQRLAERVEGNLLAAAQEIDKLALLADGQPLDVERMESLVADAARYDVFRLVEATFSGQPPTVLRMLAFRPAAAVPPVPKAVDGALGGTPGGNAAGGGAGTGSRDATPAAAAASGSPAVAAQAAAPVQAAPREPEPEPEPAP